MRIVLDFLKEQLDNKDKPFEQFFEFEKTEQGDLKKYELLNILQGIYVFFSVVENLEDQNPKWSGIASNQIYEVLKAIISLDALPNKDLLKHYHYSNLCESELIGFLYVAHQFQINGYHFGCKLQHTNLNSDAIFRVFNMPISIIKSWDIYLKTIIEHSEEVVYDEVKLGMDKALKILTSEKIKKNHLAGQ